MELQQNQILERQKVFFLKCSKLLNSHLQNQIKTKIFNLKVSKTLQVIGLLQIARLKE